MKLKKVFFVGLILCITISSCKVGRFVWYNFANITDYKIFPKRCISNDTVKFIFPQSLKPIAPKSITVAKGTSIKFDDFLKESNTVAFIVIKNDSIHYEKYFNKYDSASIVASFSVAKSVVSILIGCAIDDGLIKSVNEPITNYLPNMGKGFDKITIEHLLQMTSGIRFNESYWNPFGHAASFYYGRRIYNEVRKLKVKQAPGQDFEYNSGNTQVLGLVLEKALKGKSVSQYLQEKLWKPLQMEYSASWSLDKKNNGVEKTFCCINARARDFAKIGRLYLNKGNWNGKQVISKNWVEQSTKIDTTNGSVNYYQYCWWKFKPNDFVAIGILGQYIYVNPDKNLVMVRLGKDKGKINWRDVLPAIAANY